MTRMQARKIAWAFTDTISLIKEDRARSELLDQCAKRLHVVESQIDWRFVLEECLKQCMEERAKEQRVIAADAVAKVQP